MRRGVAGYIAVLVVILIVAGMTMLTMSALRSMQAIQRSPQLSVSAHFLQSDTDLDIVVTLSQIAGSATRVMKVYFVVAVSNGTKYTVRVGIGETRRVSIGNAVCNVTASTSEELLYPGKSAEVTVSATCDRRLPRVASVYGVVILDKIAMPFSASEVSG